MPITVNTNMSSLICQRSLSKATNGMNTALQRMSTGLRINSSKDDAAGMAISSKMDTKLSSYSVAQDNVQMGQSMLDTASGSIDTMTSMLQRMRDLSEQAANGTYGAEERKAMQAEVDALTSEIYRIKNTTEFNGKKILGEEERQYTKPTIKMSEIDVATINQATWNSTIKGKVIGISNAEDLAKVATIVNDKKINTTGTTFALTGDIDLSVLGDIDGNGSNWTAIGGTTNQFRGKFDGNGYTIENLTINKPTEDLQGLFGGTYGATIENVNLTNANVTGKGSTGGLVGRNYNNSTITNCSVEGRVEGKGNDCTGGLVGQNYTNSTITNCSATGIVKGGERTGGLVGLNGDSSTITNCSATGIVEGKGSYTGGLVGSNAYRCTITNCTAQGTVEGKGSYTGGLVGLNYESSTIINCSATGIVEGKGYTGGLVGFNLNVNGGDYTTKSTIKNCYSSCSVTGTIDVGGFVGINRESDILNCSYDKTKSTQANDVGLEQGANSKIDPFGNSTTNPFNKNINSSQPIFLTNLQVGIDTDENSVLAVNTGFDIGDFKIDLRSESGARRAINSIDSMMETVSKKSLDLGATSNRLESVKEFQRVQMSALTSASSLIKDADIAKESASYIKSQILQQTTATLLATANQNPSIALSLM